MNKNVEIYSLLMYSKGCINSGRLLEAKKAIDKAINNIQCHDKGNIDNELLRLISEGI